MAKQELKTKIHLFSEGSVTEIIYVRALLRDKTNVALDICKTGCDPATLLNAAQSKVQLIKRRRKKFANKDQVWLIFDCDDHPNLDRVLNEAVDADLHLGFSNPCFEVWLLYHFQDHHSLDGRSEVKAALSARTSCYCGEKEKLTSAEGLIEHIDQACRRSEASERSRAEEGSRLARPCSTMHKIVAAAQRL